MTKPALTLSAVALASLLSACVSGGGGTSSAQGQTVNDPSFSGVTNTEATDSSYSPAE